MGDCVERVYDGGRSVGFHQCTRKAGHGPDEKYCKLHAEQFQNPISTGFVVSTWDGDSTRIKEVGVIKETAKTALLVGLYHLGKQARIKKGADWVLFADRDIAVEFVIQRLEKRIESAHEKVSGLTADLAEFMKANEQEKAQQTDKQE